MTFLNSLKKWFYTNNSSAAGSAARIPLLDASGNAVGSDTYANLASVLGNEYVVAPNTGIDANTIEDGIIHILNGTCIGNSSNLPTGLKLGLLRGVSAFVNTANQWAYQILYDPRLCKQYFRTKEGTNWTDWAMLSYNIPDFYKSYANESSLASGLGVVNYGRTVTDANSLIMQYGFHVADFGDPSAVSNLPQGNTGWGVLLSVCAVSQTLQIVSDHSNGIWIRTADASSIKQWIKLI